MRIGNRGAMKSVPGVVATWLAGFVGFRLSDSSDYLLVERGVIRVALAKTSDVVVCASFFEPW